MSLGAFLGLEIGKKGAIAHQQALNVVGHNITNAETKGYSRQTVSLKTTAPLNAEGLAAGQIGTGVTLAEIQRIRDKFIDESLRDQKSFQGFVDSLSEGLGKLQTVLNEPSENNVRSAIDLLFQSLEDLNNQPEKASVRVTLVERAKSLATFLNFTSSKLEQERTNANLEIEQNLNRVNSIAKTLTDLNGEIQKVRNSDQNPNDILDSRDLLLDELSELVNIEVSEDSEQNLFVRVGSHLLVQGGNYNELHFVRNDSRQGLSSVESQDFELPDHNNPRIADLLVGGDANNQNFTLTVFQTANHHAVQSQAMVDIQNTFQEGSKLENAGITTGSFFVNGVQIFVESQDTVADLRDTINNAGLGISAFFERGRLVMQSLRTGTANEIVLSEGTSNLIEVMKFSDEQELDSLANVIFDGRVRDARYAVHDQTYEVSSNFIEDLVPGVDATLREVGSTHVEVRHDIIGGKLRGLLEYQDRHLDGEIRSLDRLAYAMVKEFNKIHYEGFGLDGDNQRLFFKDFKSPDISVSEKGAARAIQVDEFIQNNVSAVAAAEGVFLKERDRVPVSSGSGDGRNALRLAQLKFARIVGHTEFGLSTRLSNLNSGEGIDLGRSSSNFVVSDGEKNAVVTLEHFDKDSTIFDLQGKINEAMELGGFTSRVTLSPLAEGTIRIISNDKNLTFSEGAGTTASDLHLTVSSGASGNGSRVIETADLNARFTEEPQSVVDFYSGVVSNVGVRAQEMLKLEENTRVVSTQLENERLAVSGVSIDEELTQMIQFQQGFNASARVINTATQILDQLVNLGR